MELSAGYVEMKRRQERRYHDLDNALLNGETPGGRVPLHSMSPSQSQSQVPQPFLCPLTKRIMQDPVFCLDGHTYDREAIEAHLESETTSPITGEPMDVHVTPNLALKAALVEYVTRQNTITSSQSRHVSPSQHRLYQAQQMQQRGATRHRRNSF